MANIRKRGRRYQVQVRRKGHPSTTRTFARLEEAKAWARKQEIALDRHETGIYAPPVIMLLEILKQYRDEITPLKKSRDSETRRLNRLLRDPISSYRVCDLSSEIMAGFRDRRLISGKRAASYDLQLIRHALKIADMEWGITSKPEQIFKISFPAAPKPRERRLRSLAKRSHNMPRPFPPWV